MNYSFLPELHIVPYTIYKEQNTSTDLTVKNTEYCTGEKVN